VTKKQLYNVLSKVVRPFSLGNSHIMAILTVMGDLKIETLNYERFCMAFFDFANEKRVQDYDPLSQVV
jgi:hypothetical protein